MSACSGCAALKICCCVAEEKAITSGSDSAATKRCSAPRSVSEPS